MHKDVAYPYQKLLKYPGLRPEDLAIWEAFMEAHPKRFDHVWYNVHVGVAGETFVDIKGPAEKAWYDLTRWKIDVVGMLSKDLYACELKPNANAKALGQALCYKHLLREQWKTNLRIIPVVLTDEICLTTKKVAPMINVEVWTP